MPRQLSQVEDLRAGGEGDLECARRSEDDVGVSELVAAGRRRGGRRRDGHRPVGQEAHVLQHVGGYNR